MLISVTNLVIFATLAFHFSMCHVIGGAFNTDFGDGGDETQSSELKNAAAIRSDRTLLSRIVRRAVTTTAKTRKSPRTKPAAKTGKKGKRDQSLRARRDALACALPSDLPQMVRQLNTFLNSSLFIGLASQVDVHSPLPTKQPTDCPARTDSWWSTRSEVNLRSTCPWIYEEIDLNAQFNATYYPSKVLNARCLCQNCVTANSMSCEHIRQNITVLKVEGCRDGLAVMTKEEKSVVVGCHCANSVHSRVRVSSG